jgi:hypothetical protein
LQETTAEPVELLPFEDIAGAAKQHLQLKYPSRMLPQKNVTINRMRLGISLLTIKDEPGLGQYVPTWYIDYTMERGASSSDDVIMITAHEGEYVEPRLTPDELAIMAPAP